MLQLAIKELSSRDFGIEIFAFVIPFFNPLLSTIFNLVILKLKSVMTLSMMYVPFFLVPFRHSELRSDYLVGFIKILVFVAILQRNFYSSSWLSSACVKIK